MPNGLAADGIFGRGLVARVSIAGVCCAAMVMVVCSAVRPQGQYIGPSRFDGQFLSSAWCEMQTQRCAVFRGASLVGAAVKPMT